MHIINVNPSVAPSKCDFRGTVTVLFFQSLPFHSSDSDELRSPAILTRDKPHTPNHEQFGSLKQMVKEILCINQKILLTAYRQKKKNKRSSPSFKKINFWTAQKSCIFHKQRLQCGLFSNRFPGITGVLWLEDFLGQKNSWIWISNLTVYTVQTSLSGSTLVF